MSEIVLGALGFLLMLLAFAAGYLAGPRNKAKGSGGVNVPQTPDETESAEQYTPEELERRRQELKAEQDAFQTLLSYNPDIVYRTEPFREKE